LFAKGLANKQDQPHEAASPTTFLSIVLDILGWHDMPHLGSRAQPQAAQNYQGVARHHNPTRLGQ
jgi:hypothetical protein